MADKNQSEAFIGNGKVYFTPFKAGVKGSAFWVGVASAADFKTAVENEKELKEYHSGTSQVWDKDNGTKKTTFNITLHERRKAAMQAALQATVAVIPTGEVLAEQHTVVADDDMFFLKHKKVSAVIITDSTPTTPQPLALNVDYTIDEIYGRIEILKIGTLVQPLNIAYSHGEVTVMKPMTDDVDYYEIRVDGLNKVGQKDNQSVTAYQAKLKPADTYSLISDDFAEMSLEAELLYDDADDRKGTYEIVKL